MSDLTLATLLSSKICHDLISPVGALNNGLEILGEDGGGDMREQAMGLIRSSARSASAKLQFMRIAFGAAGSVAETIPLDEARQLSEALLEGSSVTLDWRASAVAVEKDIIKVLMNFILIGYEALPRGGTLRVGLRSEGATNIMVSAEGPKARMHQASADILRNGADLETLESRSANFYLVHSIAQSLGATIMCDVNDECIEISATI